LGQADIDRLLAARAITEEYERDSKGEDATWAFIKRLQELHFNSPQDFFKWNDKMNRLAFKECRPIFGKCDSCNGYKGTAPCTPFITPDSGQDIFANCFPDLSKEKQFERHLLDRQNPSKWLTLDFLVEYIFRLMKIGILAEDIKWEKSTQHVLCPPGHGFYIELDKMKDLPFDISWHRE
jgi:hypothetical protein